ncbi:hypothetical protein [Ochrovirga pacifica]|uniref:hypothetical protein n=1 Tax=Ochrovirga pacifica TaxID=1042376 RepID=UPI0002558ECB|nr:hypothetical protein [Ochrovirga pacifica]
MTKPFLAILLSSFVFLLTNCETEKNLNNFIDCDTPMEFNHNKVLRDAQNYFQINIGQNWKRELFVANDQTRIYAADTTRNYSSSFIVDITRFKGRVVLDSIFQHQITNSIQTNPQSYLIKEHPFTYKNQQGYGVFYFENKGANPTYFLEFYIAYPEHYYLLKSILLGSEKFEENLCESMQVLQSFQPLP